MAVNDTEIDENASLSGSKEILTSVILSADRIFIRIICLLLLSAAAYLISTVYDIYSLNRAGTGGIEYHSFAELWEINPDIAAWIKIDSTNIDHPVVHGADNYEYLGKDINGNDYAGGSIFLNADNRRDFSDRYIIIHGHHMSGGAMFGDLGRFNDEKFFKKHDTGELITPDNTYELTVAGVATVDAYDSSVYYTDHECRPLELLERCSIARDLEFKADDKLIALSTCSGDMSNNRTVVFARARAKGAGHEQ